ncbi:MAG: AbgT family transporter, partial [Prevotella sp.]|nr:AbgT family transporter [Prevotella sp.]
ELTAVHPATGESIQARSLLSAEGFRWIYTSVEHNYVSFPPLVTVLIIMIGLGVCEGAGLFTVLVKQLVLGAPKRLVTYAVIVAGIFSHLASEVGYVILIPLGAMIFHALGRHPMAGFAAAFCGVSAGFGSNFLIGVVDPILAGLSTSAAQIIDPDMYINPLVNYFFMVVSALMVTFVGAWVTEKIVEPRLGKYTGNTEALTVEGITPIEKKGLRFAGYATLIYIVLMAMTIIPEDGLLRNPETGEILRSPFFSGIVVALMLLFFVPGLVYGIVVGTVKSDKDVLKHMAESMKGMASYIILVFFAAQFIYWFNYSNLGLILAINGAEFLKSVGFTGIPLIICFILLSAFLNLFMGSASAKWAILAPVFIPMFMLLDFHPGLTQASFRIGDSVTNVITPMMSYFALIVTYAQRYDEKYGVGTIISLMIPYTLIFLLVWLVIITLWVWSGFPLGFDGPLYLK